MRPLFDERTSNGGDTRPVAVGQAGLYQRPHEMSAVKRRGRGPLLAIVIAGIVFIIPAVYLVLFAR